MDSMKNDLKFIQKVVPIVSKRKLISFTGRVVNKRKAKLDEIIVNSFIIPLHNKAKRLKVQHHVAYLIRNKRARLDTDYVLTTNDRVIKKSKRIEKQLRDGGYELDDNVAVKSDRILLQECQDGYDYFQTRLFEENDYRHQYKRYVKNNPLSTSKNTSIIRKQFVGIEDVHQAIKEIHQKQVNQYRLDLWLGYTLRNIENGEERKFLPSYNTSIFVDRGSPIINTSIKSVLDELNCENMVERTKRVNSKWSFEAFTEYVVLVTDIPEVLIGSEVVLPEYLKKSKSIVGFESVPNNLCFWFCLAKFNNPNQRLDRLSTLAKALFKEYYSKDSDQEYQGLEIEELEHIENHFDVSVNIYRYTEEKVMLERHSGSLSNKRLNLNIYTNEEGTNHFSLIVNIHNITGVVRCDDCGKFLSEFKKMKAHTRVCTKGKDTLEFIGGVYNPKGTIFDDLEEVGVKVPKDLRFYPNFLFYDFETYLDDSRIEKETTSSIQYEGEHRLLSISLIGSEEASPVYIPVIKTELDALKEMLTIMEGIRKKYIQRLYPLYTKYFQQIGKLTDTTIRKRLMRRLADWLEMMPTYGFNSGRYDLNVIKKYLPTLLIDQASKKYGNISRKEKMWLQTIEAELGKQLTHNHKIDRYVVDGYDDTTKTVYELNGCVWHGCSDCYDKDDINPMTGDKMGYLLEKTLKKEQRLTQLGYKVVTKWECQFESLPNMEVNGIVKQNNVYKSISNGKFSFQDIMAFLGPGTSYESFLKAFDTRIPKGDFCHKVTSNLTKYVQEYPQLKPYRHNVIELLKRSPIPDRKWFHNDLKAVSLDESKYNKIKYEYSNLYDLLLDYNNNDVLPAIEATKKLVKFFRDINLDIHRDGISISGLALKYLWQLKDNDADFHLFKGHEELYYKYRQNLVGGPAIIFNHYQERNTTKIRGDKMCQSIQGFDANSLYTYCLEQNMLVGNHQTIDPYPGLLDEVKNGNFFGVIEADVSVPEHLRKYFEDFQPIFKNVEIKYDDISDESKLQVDPNFRTTKLVGSFKANKMLFISDLLKWYLQHGLIVSNITLVVRYEKKAPFKKFVDLITTARRQGDVSSEYKLRGEICKLLANSCYGKTIQNSSKYERVSIVSEEKFVKNLKHPNYKTHSDLHKGYEFRFKKSNHKQDIPVQIGFCIYQLAKLRMLEFYYDMLDHFLDRRDYQAIMCDTDSLYIALTSDSLEELVKPELTDKFSEVKHSWFGRDDSEENKLYDKRTPGLFKLEFKGTGIIALCSKMYFAFDDMGTSKLSSKGLNKKQNGLNLTKERYLAALNGDSSQTFQNKGFRVKNNNMATYTMNKTGMRLWNDKRIRIGFNTLPTNI